MNEEGLRRCEEATKLRGYPVTWVSLSFLHDRGRLIQSFHMQHVQTTSLIVLLRNIGVHSPFWSVGKIRKNNRPYINYPLCRSSDFHTHFLNYRPSQNKTHDDSVSRVLLKHNSVQQRTRQGQCSTCIELHDYKLVGKHFATPSVLPRPQPSASPPSFHTAPTPGPPTARISLNRRVQLRTFITVL